MNLQYDESGDGPPIVMVHGLGATSNLWGGCMPTLSRHHRVITPDLRGSGRTPSDGRISTEQHSADLLQLIESVGVEQAHWIGHSYGSVVLQHLALAQPSAVLSLGLIGPISEPSEAARAALTARAATARSDGLGGIAWSTAEVGTSAETKASRPEVCAFIREMVMRTDPSVYAQTCDALVAAHAAPIEKLGCPTLIVTGDEDMTSPPAAAWAMARRVNGAEFHVVPRCGHWTPIERTQELTNLLLGFLVNSAQLMP